MIIIIMTTIIIIIIIIINYNTKIIIIIIIIITIIPPNIIELCRIPRSARLVAIIARVRCPPGLRTPVAWSAYRSERINKVVIKYFIYSFTSISNYQIEEAIRLPSRIRDGISAAPSEPGSAITLAINCDWSASSWRDLSR
jgi:hypothetical protein